MRKATKADIKLVSEIISDSFTENPSAVSVLKNKEKKKKKYLKGLAKYVFKTAYKRDGVYISDDEKGVAVCYKYNIKKESIHDLWNQFILAIKVIGLKNVLNVLKRESYIKAKRPIDGNFFYFWFFGVKNEGKGKGAALELWKSVLKHTQTQNLPIYLETSVEKNKNVYGRYGFELYHTWDNTRDNISLWFMRKRSL